MDFAKLIKDEILEAGDACYTCWEIEDGCECEEGFDSTLDREKHGAFDEDGPKSVEELADEKIKQLDPIL